MTAHEKLTKKVHKLFDKLGTTEKSALKEIYKDKIKAVPRDICHCLISAFFQKRLSLPVITYFAAHTNRADLSCSAHIEVSLSAQTYVYELPRHVRDLMVHFDDGKYPELIDVDRYRQRLMT